MLPADNHALSLSVYADWLDDSGLYDAADNVRVDAISSPELQWCWEPRVGVGVIGVGGTGASVGGGVVGVGGGVVGVGVVGVVGVIGGVVGVVSVIGGVVVGGVGGD
jgi:hypothetical protein